MKCSKCGSKMEVYVEIVDPKVTVYKCPKCGHKESK
jgi:DNA-directed RNA polymerase subunit RPC12/RpoP